MGNRVPLKAIRFVAAGLFGALGVWTLLSSWLGSETQGIEDKRHLYCGDRGAPTPDGVPVAMTSPGKSSQNEVVYAISPGIGKIMFAGLPCQNATLTADNATLARSLGDAHELCEQQRDVATANLIEGWVDDAQERVRFLRETNGGSGVATSP